VLAGKIKSVMFLLAAEDDELAAEDDELAAEDDEQTAEDDELAAEDEELAGGKKRLPVPAVLSLAISECSCLTHDYLALITPCLRCQSLLSRTCNTLFLC